MTNIISSFVNNSALRVVRKSFAPHTTIAKKQDAPLLISGIFRSGTSITAKILIEAGFDAGPENHLLQAEGKYAQYNPDGFLENYFFMDLSRYIFHLTNSSGDFPPDTSEVEKITIDQLDDEALRSYSLLVLREPRISNRNKIDALKQVSVHHMPAYVSHAFGKRPLIKNPHFSVLEPFFKKLFPDSKRVVVFRNPADWLRSAEVVSKNITPGLYDKYYRYYLEQDPGQFIFFNYDRLVEEPVASITKLLTAVSADKADPVSLAKLIRTKERANAVEAENSLTYSQLFTRAINS